MEKIKNTKLGKWLKSKAPNVLNTVGDLLPDQGALGLVKNLIDKDPDVDTAEGTAMVDAEIKRLSKVAQRVQREASGYHCGHTFKRQPVGVKYLHAAAETLNYGDKLHEAGANLLEKAIDLEGVIGVVVLQHRKGVEFDLVLLQYFEAGHHP